MTRFVLPDSPADLDEDLLIAPDKAFSGRLRHIADDIRGALTSSPRMPGVSYGLFGRWGTGKSSAARYLMDLLDADRDELSGQSAVCSVTVQSAVS